MASEGGRGSVLTRRARRRALSSGERSTPSLAREMGARSLFASSKSAPPRTIVEAPLGGEARARLRRDVAMHAQPALTTLCRSADGYRVARLALRPCLRRECSFEHDAIDDALAQPFGDFRRLFVTASQGRVTSSLNQYINSIDIEDCIPPLAISRRSDERSPREVARPRKLGSASLASVHAATFLPILDCGRFDAHGEDRGVPRNAEPECGGPVGGAAASPIRRTAADQFRRADASQSATRNAARAVHQLERERMSR